MRIINTEIEDVLVFEPKVFEDDRGFFMETFRQSWFDEAGIKAEFVQANHSRSKKGVLRGLHYQIDKPQGKLVRVTSGKVYDVAVDIRRRSPTFGRYVSVILSAENKRLFWVPPGLAHGFLVLSEQAELQYSCTDYYDPSSEKVLAWNDDSIGIDWPKIDTDISLSNKDSIYAKKFEDV